MIPLVTKLLWLTALADLTVVFVSIGIGFALGVGFILSLRAVREWIWNR